MMQYATRDIFVLQADLIDTKVEMAASKAIDNAIERVIIQLNALKSEVHDINVRLAKVETKMDILYLDHQDRLNTQKEIQKEQNDMQRDIQKEIKRRFIEYTFRAGWALVTCTASIIASIVIIHFY